MTAILSMVAWGYGCRKQKGETAKGYEESGDEVSDHYVNGSSSLTGTKMLKLTQIYLLSTGNLLYTYIIFQ